VAWVFHRRQLLQLAFSRWLGRASRRFQVSENQGRNTTESRGQRGFSGGGGRPSRPYRDRNRDDDRDSGGGGRGRRGFQRRVKKCAFCSNKNMDIDYKQPDVLRRFITDRGKIRPRRQTGTCAKHQRRLSVAIKRARHLALLPFVVEHPRTG